MKYAQAREVHIEEECNSLLFIIKNCSLQDRIPDIAFVEQGFLSSYPITPYHQALKFLFPWSQGWFRHHTCGFPSILDLLTEVGFHSKSFSKKRWFNKSTLYSFIL